MKTAQYYYFHFPKKKSDIDRNQYFAYQNCFLPYNVVVIVAIQDFLQIRVTQKSKR